MIQPDLFAAVAPLVEPSHVAERPFDLSGLLDRLTATCERPRYNYMLLTLIAEASAETGRAGPFVRSEGERVPIRDWLCDAMNPVGRREPRRLSMTARVREDLATTTGLPADERAAENMVRDRGAFSAADSRAAPMSAGPSRNWSVPACSSVTTKAIMWITTTGAVSAMRSISSRRQRAVRSSRREVALEHSIAGEDSTKPCRQDWNGPEGAREGRREQRTCAPKLREPRDPCGKAVCTG